MDAAADELLVERFNFHDAASRFYLEENVSEAIAKEALWDAYQKHLKRWAEFCDANDVSWKNDRDSWRLKLMRSVLNDRKECAGVSDFDLQPDVDVELERGGLGSLL